MLVRRPEGPDPPSAYPPENVRLWLLAAWAGHSEADAQAGPKPGVCECSAGQSSTFTTGG